MDVVGYFTFLFLLKFALSYSNHDCKYIHSAAAGIELVSNYDIIGAINEIITLINFRSAVRIVK